MPYHSAKNRINILPGKIFLYFALFSSIYLTLLSFFLAWKLNINWDESNAISRIFAWENGFRLGVLREGMVYIGWPLGQLGIANEFVPLSFRLFTLIFAGLPLIWMIWRISSHAGRNSAIFSVYFLLANHSFLETYFQYRTDTFFTLFYLIVFYFTVLKPTEENMPLPRQTIILSSLLLSVSFFFNPKALYPALMLGVSWLYLVYLQTKEHHFQPTEFIHASKPYVWIIAGSILLFSLFIMLHMIMIDFTWSELGNHVLSNIKTGFGTQHGWKYKFRFFESTFTSHIEMVCWAILGAGWLIGQSFRRTKPPAWQITIAIQAVLVLIFIVIHQGTYKYLAISFWPPFAILAGVGTARILESFEEERNNILIAAISLLCLVSIAGGITKHISRMDHYRYGDSQSQRATVRTLDSMFPEVKDYADGAGLWADRRNLVGFHSYKRYTSYLAGRFPLIYESKFHQNKPALLLSSNRFPLQKMRKEDMAWITENYQQAFTLLYLYRLSIPAMNKNQEIQLASEIDAQFHFSLKNQFLPRAELHMAYSLDGRQVNPTIELAKGSFSLRCIHDTCPSAQLVLGKYDFADNTMLLLLRSNEHWLDIRTEGRYFKDCKRCVVRIGGEVIDQNGIRLKPGHYPVELSGAKETWIHPFGKLYNTKLHAK